MRLYLYSWPTPFFLLLFHFCLHKWTQVWPAEICRRPQLVVGLPCHIQTNSTLPTPCRVERRIFTPGRKKTWQCGLADVLMLRFIVRLNENAASCLSRVTLLHQLGFKSGREKESWEKLFHADYWHSQFFSRQPLLMTSMTTGIFILRRNFKREHISC